MSAARGKRHRMHANPFTIRGEVEPLDCSQVFGRKAPIAVDVGFGSAAFLLELARRNPDWNVVGLEIRKHLVEDAMRQASAAGLSNVHAILANANLHLDTLLPPGSVAFVSVNFPDPWYKKRHRKRRVVQIPWLTTLTSKLAPGAAFHAMTDYEPLGVEILRYTEARGDFVNQAGPDRFAETSTTQIHTERELWHAGRGDPIYRLHFRFEPQRGIAAGAETASEAPPGLSRADSNAT